MEKLKGIFLVSFIAVIAVAAGNFFPVIGSAVFAIIIGLILRNTLGLSPEYQSGVLFSSKKILQASIVLLGFSLTIQDIGNTGLSSLGMIVFLITAAFLIAFFAGSLLNISFNLKMLIGVGTAICGGSAIAAAAPIIEADNDEVALSISTIFLFNVLAVFLFPLLGHALDLSDAQFGLWAGTAINDTSSVVAASYSYSEAAGDYATIVKLTRATFIIPVSLSLAAIQLYKKKRTAGSIALRQLFPWFILWFLVASLISSTGILPPEAIAFAKSSARFMIAMALGAIGLTADLKKLLKTGFKPILLGMIAWAFVAAGSLIMIFL